MSDVARSQPAPADRATGFWITAAALGVGLGGAVLVAAWDTSSDLGHAWAAPLLMAYLWWERWDERPGGNPAGAPQGWLPWVLVVGLIVLALPLRLLLTPYPIWPGALLVYLGLLVGFALWVAWRYGGPHAMRWVGGPLLVLPGVIPWPGLLDRLAILPLRSGIAHLVTECSNALGQPAIAAGTTIRLAQDWVGIDQACGGIRSLQACVMAALFFGEWQRLGLGRRLGLLGVGIGAALIGNLGRVGFLAWCASGPTGRLDQWHDPAGWTALTFSLVITGWIGVRWGRTHGNPTPNTKLNPAPRTPWPQPARSLVVALIALVGIEVGTRWWYAQGAQSTDSPAPLWTVRLPINSPAYRPQILDQAALDMLNPHRYVGGSWVQADGVRRASNYIEWHTGQAARHVPFLHNPTICLPSAGAELVESWGRLDITIGTTTVPFETYHFRALGEDLVVAFTIWDPARGEPLARTHHEDGWLGWWRMQWRDVAEARQHQPAQLFSLSVQGLENRENLATELSLLIVPVPSEGAY